MAEGETFHHDETRARLPCGQQRSPSGSTLHAAQVRTWLVVVSVGAAAAPGHPQTQNPKIPENQARSPKDPTWHIFGGG